MRLPSAHRLPGALLRCAAFFLVIGIGQRWVAAPIARALGHGVRGRLPEQLVALTPQLFGEAVMLLLVVAVTGLALRFNQVPWSQTGLPLNRSAGKLFAQGALLGAAGMGAVVGTIAALGGYSASCWHYRPGMALAVAALSAVSYLLVGVTEELWFRGYALQVLTGGAGFWPAALVTSLAFGFWHAVNPGEYWQAELAIAFAGMTFCFLRWLTGSLWFGIGSHAAWDYMENVVFSNPGSTPAREHLMRVRLHGPAWLTGGSAGFENSVITLVVGLLLLVLPAVWFLPLRRSPQRCT